jgi:hypothetical protein
VDDSSALRSQSEALEVTEVGVARAAVEVTVAAGVTGARTASVEARKPEATTRTEEGSIGETETAEVEEGSVVPPLAAAGLLVARAGAGAVARARARAARAGAEAEAVGGIRNATATVPAWLWATKRTRARWRE